MSKFKTLKEINREKILHYNTLWSNCNKDKKQYMKEKGIYLERKLIGKEDLTKWLLKRFSASAVDDLIKELERDNK